MTQLKKQDLINILVEEYGYEKEDLKFDAKGNPYTNAKLKALIKAEELDAQKLEDEDLYEEEAVYDDNHKVNVMSGSTGTVLYRSEISNKSWKFRQFGQKDKIPYGELVTMMNRFPRYFYDGWIIIRDKAVVEEFGLTELYKNIDTILTPEKLDEVFKYPVDELEEIINNLPSGMIETFVNRAQQLYSANRLDSLHVKRLIETKFGFSLDDNAPISDVALETDTGVQNIIYVDHN
ncbi:hypothetical protein [Bacillus phage vB_BanS-Thrax1]|nr:hypothetical protein [Bacillus phage vB_BanS-Thrax1]